MLWRTCPRFSFVCGSKHKCGVNFSALTRKKNNMMSGLALRHGRGVPTAARAQARDGDGPPPSTRLKGVVVAFDREAGRGEVRTLSDAPTATTATSPSPPQTYPVQARDILSCGHRWLAPDELVEFKLADGRATDILRTFETADGQSVG